MVSFAQLGHVGRVGRAQTEKHGQVRAELLEHLHEDGMSDKQLAALLPEDEAAIEALRRLRQPPPLPKPEPPMLVPLTVFLTEPQRRRVRRAIRAALRDEDPGAEGTALTWICEHYCDDEG